MTGAKLELKLLSRTALQSRKKMLAIRGQYPPFSPREEVMAILKQALLGDAAKDAGEKGIADASIEFQLRPKLTVEFDVQEVWAA